MPASGRHPQAIPANGHDAAPGGGGRGRSTGPSSPLRYQYRISVVVDSGGSSIPDKELILRLVNNPGIQYRLTSPLGVLVAWAVTLAPPPPQRPPLITNVSVRLSVRHNWKAFKTLKNNRKKAGPFSVGTEAAVSDR